MLGQSMKLVAGNYDVVAATSRPNELARRTPADSFARLSEACRRVSSWARYLAWKSVIPDSRGMGESSLLARTVTH